MKVLVVDDEPLIRRSLCRAFQVSGHQVFDAPDGAEGLRIWTKEQPDVVFVDVLMPGVTGPQMIEQMPAEIKTKTKIVIMSAYTGDFAQQVKNKKEFSLFIPKPFEDIFEIVKMIERLFH